MWTNDLRVLIFWTVYNYNFRSSMTGENLVVDLDFVISLAKVLETGGESKLSFDHQTCLEALQNFEAYLGLRQAFDVSLGAVSQNWNKTPDITKALLYTFLLEQGANDPNNSNQIADKKLVSNYLRLAQDYIDGAAVSLTHALLLKLLSKDA